MAPACPRPPSPGSKRSWPRNTGPSASRTRPLYARPLPAYHAIRDNPAGTPDTVAFAVEKRGFVDLITPGQYADADLVHAPGYDTITGLGSPTRALLDSFRRRGPHW